MLKSGLFNTKSTYLYINFQSSIGYNNIIQKYGSFGFLQLSSKIKEQFPNANFSIGYEFC